MKKHQLKGITRSMIESVIDEYVVGYKAERNRLLLKLRWCDGLTYEELAEKIDMSVRQVKKIAYEYETTICEHLRVEE